MVTTVSAANQASGPGSQVPQVKALALTLRDILSAPAFITAVSLLGIAFVALFWQWLVKQHKFSSEFIQDWGHAYLIPVISGYLVWRRRDELLACRPRFFWPALVPLVMGVLCYFFFIVGVPNHMFQGVSMILTLFGLALLLLGPAVMRVLFLPIAFLVCGITVAEKFMIQLTFPLQQIAAQGAWVLLSGIGSLWGAITGSGFVVGIAGNTLSIDTGSGAPHALDVAEACSGMRMVIAFVALGAAVALISCRAWWQRTALILLAVPVAVLMNIIRVAVLGLLSLAHRDLATGDAHMLIGTLLLVPGLGLFMLVVWALNRIVREPAATTPGAPRRSWMRVPDWSGLRTPAFIAALAVLVVSAAGLRTAVAQARLYLQKLPIYAPENRALSSLPIRTAHWERVGADQTASKEVEEALGTANHVTRLYLERGGSEDRPTALSFHVAYYTKMVDTVPHVPERCFVGGGMQIVRNYGERPIPLDPSIWRPDNDLPPSLSHLRGRIFTAPVTNEYGAVLNSVRLPRDPTGLRLRITEFANPEGQRLMSGYLFIANGGAVASAEGVRLLAFNLTDSYAYYLKIQFTSQSAQTPEELATQAGRFLDDFLPALMRCVPDWVEVESGEYPADNPQKRTPGAAPARARL